MDNGLVRESPLRIIVLCFSLNPCCSGQWSRTSETFLCYVKRNRVLILVVVDNGLVLAVSFPDSVELTSLNPCCSGQWSRTNNHLLI